MNVYEFTGLNIAKKLTEEEKEDRLIESLKDHNKEIRKVNPRYAAQQDELLRDYKRRMEEMRKVKLEAANKTNEANFSEESNQKVVLREFVTDKETQESWNREDERRKMLEEKHRKDIEEMMKKKPL